MYPMKLSPVCKSYIWGGERLRREYGKISDGINIAESWELACREENECVIQNGIYAGMTLSEYIKNAGVSVLGKNCQKFDRFPILIKLIDARENLSVQVHPDDCYAREKENEYGKTELWHIIDCEPDAEIIYGFKKEVTREEFLSRIKNNTLTDVLNRIKVNKGETFFIEAGILHSIGKGILLAEIQQNSDITYRVFDYGRKGADGKTRELNIEKAVDVTRLTVPDFEKIHLVGEYDGCTITKLKNCDYFNTAKIDAEENAVVSLNASSFSFNVLLVLDGECVVSGERLEKGCCCFIPAGLGSYEIKGINGKTSLLFTSIP